MTFAREWEDLYAGQRHLSTWPWSDLVSLVRRCVRPPQGEPGYRILELGCGAGANLPFLQSLGGELWGIDGSETAIGSLRAAWPALAPRLMVGDFTQAWQVPGCFDLVVDRGSLTHNACADLRRTLAHIHERLKPGGFLVSVDLFSTAFSDYEGGAPTSDLCTRRDFRDGRLAGTGIAHFADEAHVKDLFAAFGIEHLEHKAVERRYPKPISQFAAWNLVARRGAHIT